MPKFSMAEFNGQVGKTTNINNLRARLLNRSNSKVPECFNVNQFLLINKGQFMLHMNCTVWPEEEINDVNMIDFFCVIRWSCPIFISKKGYNYITFLMSEDIYYAGHPNGYSPEDVSLHLTKEALDDIVSRLVKPAMGELMVFYNQQLHEKGYVDSHQSKSWSTDVLVSTEIEILTRPTDGLVKDQIIVMRPYHLALLESHFEVVRTFSNWFFTGF